MPSVVRIDFNNSVEPYVTILSAAEVTSDLS